MRILIVRTSALGDIVHCLPVLTALGRHRPAARIGWVVEDVFEPLLAGHPALAATIPVATRRWGREPFAAATRREVAATIGRLRAFGADVALDLMGNHKGALLAALSGARRRIGLTRRARRESSSVLWATETAEPHGVHAVERALSVLDPLGIPREPADFGGDALASPAAAAGDRAAAPFCLLHAGAGWGNKVYPPERWAAVARGIAERTGLEVAVALSPSVAERALVARIVAAAGGAARPIEAGDLGRLCDLSRRARLVLGGDSGPLHLAHALGTPVVCVMGPTDPARHGPYGAPEMAIARRLPCSYCYRRFDEAKACLVAIAPEEVVERALGMLVDSRRS